jgi:hypothetical protein
MFKKFVAGVAGMVVGDLLWVRIIQPKLDELMMEHEIVKAMAGELEDEEEVCCNECEFQTECANAEENAQNIEHHHFQDARGAYWHVAYIKDENGHIDEIKVLDQLSKEEWLKSVEEHHLLGEFSF